MSKDSRSKYQRIIIYFTNFNIKLKSMHISNRFFIVCNIQIAIQMLKI